MALGQFIDNLSETEIFAHDTAYRIWSTYSSGSLRLAGPGYLHPGITKGVLNGWVTEYLRRGNVSSRRAVGFTIPSDSANNSESLEKCLRAVFDFILVHFNKLAVAIEEGGEFPKPVVNYRER